MAKLIPFFQNNNSNHQINHILDVLRLGGVIIYPTDTMYAIGCAISSKSGVNKICEIKNISLKKNRFAFICHDLSDISSYCKVDNFSFKILKKYLPGAYTFILPAATKVPNILIQSKKTVGIRIPSHEGLLDLVDRLGEPLITTTIPFEELPVEDFTNPSLIKEKYDHQVDLVLDGGIGGFIPSTVIELHNEEVEIIREGKGDIIDLV